MLLFSSTSANRSFDECDIELIVCSIILAFDVALHNYCAGNYCCVTRLPRAFNISAVMSSVLVDLLL